MLTEGLMLVITIASAAFGFYEMRQNLRLKRRILEIEETRDRHRRLEGSRAHLHAYIAGGRLEIHNSGECEAREVVIILDGIPFDQHGVAVQNEKPLTRIGPHSRATRLLAMDMAHGPPFELTLSWEDDSGKAGLYRTTLTS